MADSQDKQLAVSGAEVILLVLLVVFGMGLCVWVERAFTWVYNEPNEQQFLQMRGISAKQEELSRLESQQKAAEAQLATVELDRLKQSATIISIETVYPEIGKPKPTGSTLPQTEAEKNYETAKTQRLASDALTALLNARIGQLKLEAKTAAEKLEPEKQAATKDLQRAKSKYLLAKLGVSFLLPFFVVILALFVLRFLLNLVAGKRVWTNQGALPFLLVACALLILLSYQVFQVAGAVFIGMILFLIFLWKINWFARVGVPPAAENKDPQRKAE